jgi:NDP-sugar pyrophosphorylase family protein
LEPRKVAVILAGGYGVRTRQRLPKMFFTVNNKPVIQHLIDGLSGLVDNIFIITNKAQLKYYSSIVSETSVDISVEPHDNNEQKYGAYYGLVSFLKSHKWYDTHYLITAGDSYYSEPHSNFQALLRPTFFPQILIDSGKNRDMSQFGNIYLNGASVFKFTEKPTTDFSNWVWTGAISFPADCVDFLPLKKVDAYGNVVHELLNVTSIQALPIVGEWYDVGERFTTHS